MSHQPQQSPQHNLLSKTTSPRSCQNLICLTRRCREQQQKKQKQKILNSSYFQKLSLKKFNMNSSTFFNESLNGNNKTIKKEKTMEDSDFQNIQLKSFGGNQRTITTYTQYQNDRNTQRIIRCSSSTQLSTHQPQLNQPTIMQKQITIDLQKLQHLSKLRNTLQQQIQQLDSNIDKYYHVYQTKLEELKKIKNKLNEVEMKEQEEKKVLEQTIVDGNRLECGLFRKKGYAGEITPRVNHNQILTVGRQQKIQLANNKLNNHGLVNQSPKYSHNTTAIFNKKIN